MSFGGDLKVTTPADTEVMITRVFDAPRQMVFDAMSKAELLKQWLCGPPGWKMVECESDARVGGSFRHVWNGPNGELLAMHGEYREIDSPSRIVRTETFTIGCDAQAGEQLGSLTLTEKDGKTYLKVIVTYPSKEARDMAVSSGMEHGIAASYDRLDDVLESK